MQPLRDLVRRARAPELLVQLARTARASAATGSARASRSTPSSSSRTTTWPRRRRHRAVVRVPEPLLRPGARGGRRRVRLRASTRRGRSWEEGARRGAVRHRRPRACTSRYRNRYGRQRSYNTAFEGVVPVARAAPLRVRERPRPRADRGLHARGAVPGVRRRAPAPGVARRHRRRQEHLRGRRARRSRRPPTFLGDARAVRARPHDRRAGAEGGQRAAAVPARRRPRLPQPQPFVGHARRRRGAAHPARVADRERARRRALRARRAVDRAAPARQPAAHRHARSACATSATR